MYELQVFTQSYLFLNPGFEPGFRSNYFFHQSYVAQLNAELRTMVAKHERRGHGVDDVESGWEVRERRTQSLLAHILEAI